MGTILSRTYRLLVERPKELQTVSQVIGWWEIRRAPYNLLVGLAGLINILIIIVALLLSNPDGDLGDPFLAMMGIPLYGIMANVCYTAGWIVELLDRKENPSAATRNAINNLKRGFLFSILLTLLLPWALLLLFVMLGLIVRLFSG
ncbi:MAG: hypothetical protein KAU35_07500 [candidate division Zixibacteria bacterium]|nr:hypothetical protein [candidate division Zixibacteria bacterium]